MGVQQHTFIIYIIISWKFTNISTTSRILMRPEAQWWQVMKGSQEFMQNLSRIPQMKNILTVNQNKPYKNEGQQKTRSQKNTSLICSHVWYLFYGYFFTCGRFEHKVVNCFSRRNFETMNNHASLRQPQYSNRYVPFISEE